VDDARVGVDLVDVPAFAARFEGREDALAEVFTQDELAYCRRQRSPWAHLAARLAAKEAALKALRTGLAGTMRWRDIAVARDPAGAPRLVVTGCVGEELTRQRLAPSSVSLSHTGSLAVAVVVLVSVPT
jgi:holo-[acyl-carrier protein] synthase